MWNLQYFFFIWMQRNWQISKSALVTFNNICTTNHVFIDFFLIICKVLCISDGCCTEFNIYIICFKSYIFQVNNDPIFNLMMLIERELFWKTMLVVIYAKILHHSFIRTIYKNFKSVFFYLSRTHDNLETCIQVWFE